MILPFKLETDILSNISNTRKSVSSAIQTLRRGLKKRGAAEFVLTSKCLVISSNILLSVRYNFSNHL